MYDKLSIKSRIKDYEVNFIDDFIPTLEDHGLKNSFFIIDKRVKDFCENVRQHLFPEDRIFVIEPLEQNKTLEHCRDIVKTLIRENIRKNNMLIAIGGGIVQDITAFIGSILFRGISWIFYPTTLLAQADSCIGSKSSLNLGKYKNLLGTFYPPSKIFIDLNFLKTLSTEAIKSGIGEMLHFYFIAGSELASRLMDNYEKIISSPDLLKEYILTSLKIKKNIIEIDEFDKNERNILNYGHTFGHAIETISDYTINHGQAVTLGMDIANYISLQLGYLDTATFESMHRILKKNMPGFALDKEKIKDYLTALSKDKKNVGNNLVCILTRGPSSMHKQEIPLDEKFKRLILNYFEIRI